MAFQDLTGQRFGRLTVISRGENAKNRQARWYCLCDCGNTSIIVGSDLRTTHTKSCGCLLRTHNMTKTKTYRTWIGLKVRCTNPYDKGYPSYGGRGITICPRWLESFENFLEDMGEAPEAMSLDRIDNNGNYEPGNCRWATMKEQGNNRRSNRLIEFEGKTQTIMQWAREKGLTFDTLRKRLESKWSVEEALTLPVRSKLSSQPK